MADRHLIDVHLLLVREGQVLLTRCRDTNPMFDGRWPSGKLDAGESVLHAAVREADEEVGVLIDPDDLRHVHTLHVRGSGPEPRLGLFFETRHWVGEPTNREPDKCSAVSWFPLDALPDTLIDYPAAGIHGYRTGISFSVHGWTPSPSRHHVELTPSEGKTTPAPAHRSTRVGAVPLRGGVGMLGCDDLALPYPWVRRNGITIRGQWMYPPPGEREPHHAGQVGLLDLARFDVTEFGLDHANSAVAHAAKASGRFAVTVIRP